MMINTETCTPIAGAPPEAIIRPNRYILQPHQGYDNIAHNNDTNTRIGCLHQTLTPIVTPTKVSVQDAPKKKCTNMSETLQQLPTMNPWFQCPTKKRTNNKETLDGRHSMASTVKSTMVSITPGAPKKKTKIREETLARGRHIKYLPTLVYTPVQTSARQHGKSPYVARSTDSSGRGARRLLSTQDMDELNVRLEQLFIGCHSSNQPAQENEEEDHNKTSDVTTTSSTILGRVEATTFSYKTCAMSSVLRSARFQT
jgi:hypothetical protein